MQGILSKPLSREQAEKVWQYYGQHQDIFVPGLTILEKNMDVIAQKDILNIEATEKRVGSKENAEKMISDFVRNLEIQFLPILKTAIDQKSHDQIRFQLHQQIGAAAYIEVPLLRQTLLSVQNGLKNDEKCTSLKVFLMQ